MNKEEFTLLIVGLESNYRNFTLSHDKTNMRFWFANLSDIDYETAKIGINKLIQEFSFPPTIADIRKACISTSKGEVKDYSDAWEQVTKAIRVFGIHKEDEALKSMDEDVRHIVRSIGFKEICMTEKMGVERAHFEKMYSQRKGRNEKERVLSLSLKENIEQLQIANGVKQNPLLEGGNTKVKYIEAKEEVKEDRNSEEKQSILESINQVRELLGKEKITSLEEIKKG